MLNVTKGWPLGHASEGSYQIREGQNIVEGDFVKIVDRGDGTPVVELLSAADSQDAADAGGQALDTNTMFGYDVRMTGMLPVVLKNYVTMTDRFGSSAFAPGDVLRIDTNRPGSVVVGGGGPRVGVVEAFDQAAGVLTLRRD